MLVFIRYFSIFKANPLLLNSLNLKVHKLHFAVIILVLSGCFAGLYSQPDTVWSYKAKKPFTSMPLLEVSKYYIGTENGSLLCLDAESGKVIWETKAPADGIKKGKKTVKEQLPKKGKSKAPGNRPLIKYGFTGMLLTNPNYLFACNVDNTVCAFNKDNGVKMWSYKANLDFEHPVSLLKYDNYLIFRTEDSLVVALNQESGTEVWKYKCAGNAGGLSLKGNEVCFATSDRFVITLNAGTGTELNKISLGDFRVNEKKGIVVIDNNCILLSDSGNMAAFSVKKKKELWQQAYKLESFVEADERLIAYNDSLMVGIKMKNGAYAWKLEGVYSDRSSPVIFKDKLYFHASSKNKLMIVNTKTGEYTRSYLVKGPSVITPAVNDKIIVLVIEDRIFAIKND